MEASSLVPNRSTLDRSESFSSTKRRHHHHHQPPPSSQPLFRQPPPPPIKLSSGESLFRILCPATKTGGVIGKGGAIIRQLREETGAKIRIDDPIPGCDERVILIVAPHSTPTPTKKDKEKDKESSSFAASAAAAVEEEVKPDSVVDTNSEEELAKKFEEDEEVESPAQQALLRIFERILKVKEERSSGGGESKSSSSSTSNSENENKEGGGGGVGGGGVVVCRLLAPSSQIGSVLGKGGKIIERIRHDSGAHVRVLHKDLLPPCSSPSDELIQITGKFSAVRKAVLSVSGCLQDHSRGDAPNSATTKSSGMTLHGTGTENSRMVVEEVVFKLLCQVEKVGSLIGKGGSVIRVLQNETGASIKIADAAPDSDERVVIISARENLEQRHSPSQDAVIRVHSRIAEIGFEPGSAVVARLLVHSQQIGYLFGKGGIVIPELRRVTGASIRIFPKEQFPKYGSQNDEVVQVIGSLQSVQDALFQITSRLREIIFPVNPHQYLPPYPEMPPPMFRPRHDPASPGYPSPVGFSRGGDHGSIPAQPPEPWPTYSHGMDRLGPGYLERVPYPYGSERPGHAPLFDRQASPGRWTSQAGGGRVSDVGGGFSMSSGPAGSGNQAPVVGSTSVEVVIPQIFLNHVYGENNSNLVQIRRISGANVVVHDPRPGATEGVVVVTGTPDQLRAAQSLIHAFILSERDI